MRINSNPYAYMGNYTQTPQTQSNLQILDKENKKGKDNRDINGIQLEPIEAQSSTTKLMLQV